MTDETPSQNVMVTATAPMSVLRHDDDESLLESLARELDEELTPERALAFFEDATLEVEPLETDH